jgi:hypothetical protein
MDSRLASKEVTEVEQWLDSISITDDPCGDLIADMRSDFKRNPEKFPPMFTSIDSMHSVIPITAWEAHAVVPAAWARYKAWCRRQTR